MNNLFYLKIYDVDYPSIGSILFLNKLETSSNLTNLRHLSVGITEGEGYSLSEIFYSNITKRRYQIGIKKPHTNTRFTVAKSCCFKSRLHKYRRLFAGFTCSILFQTPILFSILFFWLQSLKAAINYTYKD